MSEQDTCARCGAEDNGCTFRYQRDYKCGSTYRAVKSSEGGWRLAFQSDACRIRELEAALATANALAADYKKQVEAEREMREKAERAFASLANGEVEITVIAGFDKPWQANRKGEHHHAAWERRFATAIEAVLYALTATPTSAAE